MAEAGQNLERYLRDRDVAALLSCSKSTVWARVQTGALPPPVKIMGLTRWKASTIAEALEEASQRPSA